MIAQRYAIEAEIGRGGMAVVYRARDERLNRDVALKLLHPYLATQTESVERFEREGSAIAKLHHPNIVEIYDMGQDEATGAQYIVMELVTGPTLLSFIKQHSTQIPEVALAMGCCLCDAIEHAHQAGIIHRDIKPENILIEQKTGTLKLTDFGIARILDADRMTASGSLIGSPAHMPPEIIEGASYGFTCDIFSLGTVLYYALTSSLPFKGTTPVAIFKSILDGQFQPPSRSNLTILRAVDQVVAQCLQKDPEQRYATPGALKAALLTCLTPLNFENYNAILKEYFSDPDGFNAKYIPIIIKTLNESAKIALKARTLSKTLELLNCILSYDPKDESANALLRQVRRGNALKRALWIGGGAFVGVMVVLFVVFALFFKDDEATPEHKHDLAENSEQDRIEAEDSVQENITAENSVAKGSLSSIEGALANGDTQALAGNVNGEMAALQEEIYRTIVSFTAPKSLISSSVSRGQTQRTVAKNGAVLTGGEQEKKSAALRMRMHRKPKENARRNPAALSEKTKLEEAAKKADAEQKMMHVVQPVFPPDAFAIIDGKRYLPNSSGDIIMDLPLGTYKMVLTCNKRCRNEVQTLTLDGSKSETMRDVVSLDWADGSLTIYEPEGAKVYFVARRLDDRSNRTWHLVSRTPNVISGFNAFGRPVIFELYAIPQTHTLNSYDQNALENAKLASTRVSINPGESKSVRF